MPISQNWPVGDSLLASTVFRVVFTVATTAVVDRYTLLTLKHYPKAARIRYRLPEFVTAFLSSEMHSDESLLGSFSTWR